MKITDAIGVIGLIVTVVVALIIVANLQVAGRTATSTTTATVLATILESDDHTYSVYDANYTTVWISEDSTGDDYPAHALYCGQDDGSENGGNYSTYRVGLFFDPSTYLGWDGDSLPDYTVVDAKMFLNLLYVGDECVGDLTIQGDIVTPNWYPDPTLTTTDYNKTYYGSTNFGSLNVTGLADPNPEPINITFTAQGVAFLNTWLDEMIDKQAWTYGCFMLRMSDDIAGVAPVGYEGCDFDGGNGEVDPPILYVQLQYDVAEEDAQDAMDTLFNNAFVGLTLASVGIIVSAAVGILALVMGAFKKPEGT